MPDWVFGKTGWGLLRRSGLLLIWAFMSGHNMPVAGDYLFTWVPMLALIWLGYTILKSRGVADPASDVANIVASPLLGHRALIFASVWLALIYIVSYTLLLPELLPPVHIQLVTLAFYPVLLIVLKTIPPRTTPQESDAPPSNPAKMPAFWLLAVFATGFVVSIIIAQGETFRIALAIVPFVSMVPLGAGLFIWLVLWKSVLRRNKV